MYIYVQNQFELCGGILLKKKIISLFLVIAVIVCMGGNLLQLKENVYTASGNTEKGIEYLDKLSLQSVEEALKEIKKVEEEYNSKIQTEEIKRKVKESLKLIKKGKKTYKKVFRDVVFAGDSLMAGLEAYDILNKKKIVAQVSASLYHLDENLNKIIKKNPKVLILHYGINMLATEEVYLNNYISMYTRLIKKLKKELPDTRIIVSLIFPVDRTVAKAKRFGRIPKYNKALIKMSRELKVEYLDSSSVLKAHKECYGSDGIHQAKAFYDKYWLKFIMEEKGIY